MPHNLVIVESPAKAKTISKYLGKDFDVLASADDVISADDRLVVIGQDVALLAAAVAARCPDEPDAG